ncbi:MAG: hypothetical protein AAFX03_04450 [Pseudomonadota bacterium]
MPDTERHDRQQAPEPPLNAVSRGFELIVRQTFAIIGLSLIAISIPLGLITPFIPLGLPLGILGVVLLGRSTVWGQRWMESILRRHPKLERLAPNWLMKMVFGRNKNAQV